jgi:hypothetical protein
MLNLFVLIASAASGGGPSEEDAATAAALEAAARGPAGAMAALFTLNRFERVDEAFSVADAYYLREGHRPVPLRKTEGEASVNDQHRRVTQILFTPGCRPMRRDPRFELLCTRTGLAAYWERTGLKPDFLRADEGISAER